MARFFCFVPFVSILWSGVAGQLRLPGIATPSSYDVELELGADVFTGNDTGFTGNVGIVFKVNASTDEIKINSLVTVNSASLTDANSNQVTISSFDDVDSNTQMLTIALKDTLSPGIDYTLNMSFNGTINIDNNDESLFRADYLDDSGSLSHLVATQFEANFARGVFPCFDENKYKAAFQMTFTYPSGLNIRSNSPQQSTGEASTAGFSKTTFSRTPVMSTFPVAFAIGDFTCTEGIINVNVSSEVCSLRGLEEYRTTALEVLPEVVAALEILTGIPYDSFLPKLSLVAMPALGFNGEENWGMMTYRDSVVLSGDETSDSDLQFSLMIIFHETSHSWFGDLVTPSDWDYLYLKEGFAVYFQHFVVPSAVGRSADFQLDRQFYTEQMQWGLLSDSSSGAVSMNSHVDTQEDINNKPLDEVNYAKAATVLRMFQIVIGEDNFFTGVKNYLNDHVGAIAAPSDLWDALSPFFPDVLDVSFTTAIKNWTDLPGHPLVTVTANGNDVVLSQRRFLNPEADDDSQWYVPLSYTLSSDSDRFADTSPRAWLVPGQDLTLQGALNGNEWIVLNNQAIGFFRVNYDQLLWGKIQSALANDINQIDVLNRAQIAYDLLSFADSGLMNYTQALSIAKFLKNETEYLVWYPVIASLNRVVNRIGAESSTGVKLSTYYRQILNTGYQALAFNESSDHMYALKQSLILNKMCWLGEESCVNKTKELYAAFKSGTSVPKNLRSTVYCTALKFSDDPASDYEFLFSHFQSATLPNERDLVINNIGCLTDPTSLKRFLNETLDPRSGILVQDFDAAWVSVYATEKVGTDTAMEFLANNYDRISAYLPGEVSSLLFGIADRFWSQDQLDRLQAFANSSSLSADDRDAANSALSSAMNNVASLASLSANLDSFLDVEFSSAR
ncbi:aminopeptidase N-like [Cylas formicarius]|uniref:aminopeptidase N-like n=1 Tax=Cylas formicarius TaxID=197179 RepID=UPI0029589E3E|nr:aminopeptidase N-like [Cylas formicarius]